MPWPIQNLRALVHWYDGQSKGFEVLSVYGEVYGNDNKQYHVGSDIETSAC